MIICKKNIDEKKLFRVIQIVSAILLFVLFCSVYWVQVKYCVGDVYSHLTSALVGRRGYSLNLPVFYFFAKYTFPNNFGIAVFLAMVTLATVCVGYSFLLFIDKNFKKNSSPLALWIIACLMPFIGSIYIPRVYPYFYENTISPIVWHNATVIEMRLFGLISLLYFFKIYYGENVVKLKEWLIFTLALLVGNAFKPNYMLGFVPIVGLCFLIQVIKDKSQLKKVITLGIGIIIAALPLFYQWFELYGQGGSHPDGGVSFVLGARLLQVGNPYLKIICGLSFVIIMLLLWNRFNLDKETDNTTWEKVFWFINGMWFVNLFLYCFMLEKNDIHSAGNWGWGLKGILYFVNIMDIYILFRACDKENGNKKLALGISVIPALQLLCGGIYTVLLILTHKYYF